MKKLISVLAIMLAAILIPTSVFAASVPSISVPITTIVRGDEGSIHKLAEVPVDKELIGMECRAKATAKNQSSVHPNNNIIVKSNGTQVVLKDVERKSNEVTNAEGILKLGDKLVVNLELGKDKVFSGGIDVELHCENPKTVEVCRDNKVITIAEDKRLETDTDAPCPEEVVLATQKVKQTPEPEVLPQTGLGSTTAVLVVAIGLGAALLHSFVQRKNLSSSK